MTRDTTGASGTRSRSGVTQNSRVPLVQAASAIALSAAAYLILIVLQQRPGEGLKYQERFFGHWTQFLCVLLTFWSLSILFTKLRGSARRGRSVSNSSIPEPASLSTEEGADALLAAFWEAARRYRDDFLATRVERLVGEFRFSRDPIAVAATLNSESEAAQTELESGYAPVRIFSWTIPVLGFIGTVLGIGQAVGGFTTFLLTSAPQPDEVRRAVGVATSNLAFALDTTLVAVLLTVIVTVAYILVQNKEKALLRAVDEFCRLRLLPLMRRQTEGQEILAADGVPEVRRELAGPAAETRPEESPEKHIEADLGWPSELATLRAELTDAFAQSAELGRQYLAENQAVSQGFARRLNETEALLTAQREILDAILQSMRGSEERSSGGYGIGPDRVPVSKQTDDRFYSAEEAQPMDAIYSRNGTLVAASSSVSSMEGVRPPLEDLRDTIREVNPILRRLAEHLRQQVAEGSHPISVRFDSSGHASVATAGE